MKRLVLVEAARSRFEKYFGFFLGIYRRSQIPVRVWLG